jgi:protein phosphatase 1 regulatory subunit 7
MERLTDLTSLDESYIAGVVARGAPIVIQYSEPVYTAKLLQHIDALCRRHGERLEVRFFGHDGRPFDCQVLDKLPHVQRLSLDCLTEFSNLEALFALPSLRHLSFGAFAKVPKDFLAHDNFKGLRSLTLGESKTPSIDLSPITGLSKLEYLNLVSHHHGIEALGLLTHLRWLTLSRIKKGVPLGFVPRISALRTLRLILGGRDDLHEVTHPTLERLEVIRVRGFANFHPDAFPSLTFLQLEDQIRLSALHFTTASQSLAELLLLNCKTLGTLTGIKELGDLRRLRIYKTAIDFEAIVGAGLPTNLKEFAFYTGTSRDTSIRRRLDSLGFDEFGTIRPVGSWYG